MAYGGTEEGGVSTVSVVQIACDVCNDEESVFEIGSRSRMQTRRAAKRDGWRFHIKQGDRLDLCPQCASKEESDDR